MPAPRRSRPRGIASFTSALLAGGVARRWLLAVSLLVGAVAPAAAQADRYEPTIRRDQQQALWPADIVRLSRDYLAFHPRGPVAAQVRGDLDRAEQSSRLLERKDVRLYRADFDIADAPSATRSEIRAAALGDKAAAQRLATLYANGDGGLARDRNRYVGWLQYAAALGNGAASYELALHYRREDQPALAAPYEARAEELGYTPPTSLDHVRK